MKAFSIKKVLGTPKNWADSKNYLFLFFICLLPQLSSLFLHYYPSRIVIILATSFAFLLPALLFPSFAKKYATAFILFIYPFYFFDIIHYLIFSAPIHGLAINAIIETNLSEIREFLHEYINAGSIFTVSLLIILPCALVYQFMDNKIPRRNWKWIAFCLCCLCLSIYKGVFSVSGINKYQLEPVRFYASYQKYQQDLQELARLKSSMALSGFKNITSIYPAEKKETYVVVLGESVDRNHMGVYGYARNTTPHFSGIKDELILFDRVSSPHASTKASLNKILTFADTEFPELAVSKGSLINFFNDAGFKSFWISNQFRMGVHDMETASYAEDASVCVFHNLSADAEPGFDEVLLPDIQQALHDTASKKVIFIHLLGSHSSYSYRYPAAFAQFKTSPLKAIRKTAEYDNSILYTDYILYQILSSLKQNTDQISFFLYLADHGEEVSESSDSCFCHNDSLRTEEMLRIPLILWQSEAWKTANRGMAELLQKHIHQEYNSEDLIHSLLYLAGLRHSDIREDKMITSDQQK